MSRIAKAIVNLRIGTKLAITSGLSIVLVLAMLGAQMVGDAAVSQSNASTEKFRDLEARTLAIKATVRGLQIATASMRAALTKADLDRGKAYYDQMKATLDRDIQSALRYVTVTQDRARIQKINGATDVYDAHVSDIYQLKTEALSGGVDDTRLSDINSQVEVLAIERIMPVAQDMESLSDQVVQFANRTVKEESEKAAAVTDFTEKVGFGIAGVVALFMVAAAVFSMMMIARPLRALTGGMLELADGNFDVVLPGLGRKDEVGDIAAAVETFKIKSAEKARREAEAKAEAERAALAERSERERIAAREKAEQDARAAQERDAAAARVMQEFDAAVGGIVQAAMHGDFSQRVPLEGKDGVIRNLAESLNAMCDNIGAVLDDLVGMMGALAEGDLTRRIVADYRGTFGTLKDSANATAERLAAIVADIKAAAAEVANAAAEIATSSSDLSQRTEEQAAGLEETSASMEQMAATVKKNAENALEANNLTAGTRKVADRGGAVVANAVGAMARIEESSRRISDIIGVIDEIARQTNLLALNAAVEAARAGDAGRGFAVVASEVRSLAQRSSQAAKDIKDLITKSNAQVGEGVSLVNQAGASLQDILESINNVASIVADIANASAEQATGIEQVNRALAQMDEVTQQNSALVEENAATAKTLEAQSAAMNERMGFFRLDAGEPAAVVTPLPTRPAAPVAAAPAARAGRRGGIVGRMQTALATALKKDPEWDEF